MTVAELVRTKKDLAAALGHAGSLRSIYNWAKLADFPGGKRGPWDPDAVRAWSTRRRSVTAKDRAEEGTRATRIVVLPGTDPATLDVETRFRYAKARAAELELKVREGELVEWAGVEQLLVARGNDLRKHFGGLGRKLCGRLEGKRERAIQRLIDDEIATYLAEFCRKAGLADLLEE